MSLQQTETGAGDDLESLRPHSSHAGRVHESIVHATFPKQLKLASARSGALSRTGNQANSGIVEFRASWGGF